MSTWQQVKEALSIPPYGILRSLRASPLPPGAPWLHVYRAQLAAPLAYPAHGRPFRYDEKPLYASGAAFEADRAIWCALGEAVERYAACAADQIREMIGTGRELGECAVSPAEWIAYADTQYDRPGFQYRRYDPDKPISWLPAKRLRDRKDRYIPASLVWLRSPFLTPAEQFLQPVSTGLAVGQTFADAVDSGLLEVIERDAFACHWLLHWPAERRRETESEVYRELGPRLSENWALEIFELSCEFGVPVLLARSKVAAEQRQSCILGASAGFAVTEVAIKALVESIQTRLWSFRLSDADRRSGKVTSFLDHVRYYLDEEHALTASWLFGEEHAAAQEFPKSRTVEDVIGRLADEGYDAYAVDLTTPEIADLGLHAVKVLVPGLQPLSCGEGFENLDSRRLKKFVAARGAHGALEINLAPHPFP